MMAVQYLLVAWMMYILIFSIFNLDKKNKIGKLNIIIFICFAILDIFRYLHHGAHIVHPHDIFWGTGTIFIVMMHALQGYKKISIGLVVIISFLLVAFMGHIAASFLLTSLNISTLEINENPTLSILGLVSGLALLQLFHLITRKLKLQIPVFRLNKQESVMIIFFLVIFGYYVDNMYITITHDVGRFRFFMNILSLLVGLIPVLGMAYIITQKDYIKYIEAREKEQDLLFEEERIHYEQKLKKDEEMSGFKHDIDDEIDYLWHLMQKKDINEMSKHLVKMKGVTAKLVKSNDQDTGLAVTNASWYALISNDAYADIKYKWLGKLPSHIAMDNRDIVRLFSNLLKNAFEAATLSKGDKYVEVQVIEERNRLAVTIKNSYLNKIKAFEDGTLKTTKLKREKHGIGTRIIKEIVEAYNGKIKYDYDENEFITRVSFGGNIYQ